MTREMVSPFRVLGQEMGLKWFEGSLENGNRYKKERRGPHAHKKPSKHTACAKTVAIPDAKAPCETNRELDLAVFGLEKPQTSLKGLRCDLQIGLPGPLLTSLRRENVRRGGGALQ